MRRIRPLAGSEYRRRRTEYAHNGIVITRVESRTTTTKTATRVSFVATSCNVVQEKCSRVIHINPRYFSFERGENVQIRINLTGRQFVVRLFLCFFYTRHWRWCTPWCVRDKYKRFKFNLIISSHSHLTCVHAVLCRRTCKPIFFFFVSTPLFYRVRKRIRFVSQSVTVKQEKKIKPWNTASYLSRDVV